MKYILILLLLVACNDSEKRSQIGSTQKERDEAKKREKRLDELYKILKDESKKQDLKYFRKNISFKKLDSWKGISNEHNIYYFTNAKNDQIYINVIASSAPLITNATKIKSVELPFLNREFPLYQKSSENNNSLFIYIKIEEGRYVTVNINSKSTPNQEEFIEFIQSIKLHMKISDDKVDYTWDKPLEWQKSNPRERRLVTFTKDDAELYVSVDKKSEEFANYTRWAKQMNHSLSIDEYNSLEDVTILGITTKVLVLEGDYQGMKQAKKNSLLLAAMVSHGDKSIAIKMIAPKDRKTYYTHVFYEFVASLKDNNRKKSTNTKDNSTNSMNDRMKLRHQMQFNKPESWQEIDNKNTIFSFKSNKESINLYFSTLDKHLPFAEEVSTIMVANQKNPLYRKRGNNLFSVFTYIYFKESNKTLFIDISSTERFDTKEFIAFVESISLKKNKAYTWQVPTSWQEIGSSGMRLVTCKKDDAELYVVILNKQSAFNNYTRWASQVGNSLSKEDFANLKEVNMLKKQVKVLDLLGDYKGMGKAKKDILLMATMVDDNDKSIFVKMIAPKDKKDYYREVFYNFCNSFKK